MVHASNSTRDSNGKRKKRSSSSTATDCETPIKRRSIEASRPSVKMASRTTPPSLQGILAKKSKQKQAMYKQPASKAKYSEPQGYKSMRVEVPPNYRPKTSKRHQSPRYDYEDDDYDDEYVASELEDSEESEECDSEEGFQTESENGDDFEHGFPSDREGEEVGAELNNLTLVDQNEEATGPQTSRKFRGSTKLKEIHDRTEEAERQTITLNAKGQPIGDHAGTLSRFIGTMARKKLFAPVTYATWKDLPEDNKKDIWKYLLVRYDIPEKGKKWVMRTFKDSWQRFKSRVKTYLYEKYETFEERLANCPDRIPQEDAKKWLEHLEKEDVKAMCLRNKANRQKYKFINRVGPISYAVIRNIRKNASEDKREPDEIDFFIDTRSARKKPLDEETAQVLAELKALKESGDKSALDAKFKEVMGKEHPGSVRLHGRCVTKTALKHASAHETSTAEKQQERERLKDELRVELRQETADQIRTGFQMLVSCLRDANPSLVIPATMPTLPMDNRNPDDSSSAPRANALSSAATNSPSGVLADEVEDGS